MRFRLKEGHPTQKKLDELFKKMDELGLSIELGPYNKLTVRDRDRKEDEPQLRLEDIERVSTNDESGIYELPPNFEWHVVYERKERT